MLKRRWFSYRRARPVPYPSYRLLIGILVCSVLSGYESATGKEFYNARPILPPRTSPLPNQSQVGVLAALMTQLQDHGYKAIIRSVPLPYGSIEAIQTGVNGASVQIAAPPCPTPDQTACMLSFKTTFLDERQLATDDFCLETARKFSIGRLFPIVSPDGRKMTNMVYVLLYTGEPDIKLVETALNMFGSDIDRYRSAYHAASTVSTR